MIHRFSVGTTKPDPTRKFPWLPRFGFVVEIGGRRFSYKHASLLEACVNLMERGVTLSNLERIAKEQLFEITFVDDAEPKIIDVKARSVRDDNNS